MTMTMRFTFADFELDTDLFELRQQGAVRPIRPRGHDVRMWVPRRLDADVEPFGVARGSIRKPGAEGPLGAP